jgi:hypothetical protein
MSVRRFRWYAAAITIGILVLSEQAQAGGAEPCTDPVAFEEASVNAVVLPFENQSPRDDAFQGGVELGEQLSALAQAEVLMSMLKYGSVGATRLYSPSWRPCNPLWVVDRLTHGEHGTVQAGHGLVLIWGRIYVEDSRIYLQSFLRFLRRGVTESITVTLPDSGGQQLVLRGPLPRQSMAMQVHLVTREDLTRVASAFRTQLVVRTAPNDQSPGIPFEVRPAAPFSYRVVETAGDWMRIQSTGKGPSGWVKARTEGGEWGLRRLMPELSYLDGLVGYERLRDKTPLGTLDPQKLYTWVTADFERYEEAVGRESAPLPLGLSRMLRGFLLWDRATEGNADVFHRQAAELFSEALKFIPDYGGAHNLAAITGPYLHEGRSLAQVSPQVQRELDAGLLGALAVDANNAAALDNLARLYEFVAQDAKPATLYPNLQERLKILKAVRASVRAPDVRPDQ